MLFSAIVFLVTSDIERTGPFMIVVVAAPTAPTRATAPKSMNKTFPDWRCLGGVLRMTDHRTGGATYAQAQENVQRR